MMTLHSVVLSLPVVYGIIAALVLGVLFGWWLRPRIESTVKVFFHEDTEPGRS